MAIPFLSAVGAALIGTFAWREWQSVGLTILVPFLAASQVRRRWATVVVLSYYGAASWPLIEVFRSFAGEARAGAAAVLTWVLAITLLSAPLSAAWTNNRTALAWRIPLALIAGILPPLALIGWASPVTAAGALFPGTEWCGLIATTVLPGLLLQCRPCIWALVAFGSVVTQFSAGHPAVPPDWQTVQTAFGAHQDFEASEFAQQAIATAKARAIVFPEMTISRWTAATEAFWQPTLNRLVSEHHMAVLGAGISIPESTNYQNAAVVTDGASTRAFLQRVPVPFGMWRPFGPAPSVPLRWLGPGTIRIADQRVAVLICYEQLLVWPVLRSAAERPTLILGMANQYWVCNTNIPAAQRASLQAWARLFNLPVLMAENK